MHWPSQTGFGFLDPHGNDTLCLDGLTPQDLFGPRVGSSNASDGSDVAARLQGLLVTVNVQSLCEDDQSPLPNRAPYVREQLEGIGCSVAGLQETRAKAASTITSASHIRFTSGCDNKGCLGVELWFSRLVPFGWIGDSPLKFAADDFRVLHWTPRILVVRFARGSLRVLFVSCHAPNATSPERDVWWKGFADLLCAAANNDKVVILGDLNARLCEPVPGRIGQLVWEQEHRPPAPFFRLLNALDLWVPSTFPERHKGLSHTWSAPGGTATSRIDFVLIPVSWWVPSGGSSVLHEVDFGQTGLDHFAAQLFITVDLNSRLHFCASGRRFDHSRAFQPESASTVQTIFAGVPAVPWEVDAHRHYHAASSYLLGELSRHFPVKGCTRRRPFFSDTTWSLRQQRTWLRKRAHRASGTLKLYDVHCAFQAWRTDGSFRYELQRHFSEVFRCIAQLRHSVVELRKLKPAFRKSLRRDKGLYITQVALQAATSNTKDVVQRLRPLLGPPRRKQRGIAPLPVVRLEDGTFASTPQEADARWLRHFSAAEHGGPIEPDDLIQRCLNRQYGADLDAFDVDPHDLPTKCELEQAFRAAQPGRASGNDGMPPDILHLFPGEMAKIFYPVLLKVAFRLQEPIQFKGGSVSHIYKHKGDQADCTNHRGILISNNIGKGFHSAFRRKCGAWYDQAATPLQTGGRRGFPVTLASQTVRSYQEGHLKRGRSVAVVFLDLKEAFHKVARPLVHGGNLSDEHLAKVMQSLDLSPDHLHLLRSYVREDSLLIPAGASPWAASVVREFQEDSWLTVGSGLAAVESGTRPGDSLADIVFSFLFASVLKKVRAAMITAGYHVWLPWSDSWHRTLNPEGVPDQQLAPIDVSWMDDLALMLSAATPEALVEAVKGASSALIDECLQALLHPNLAPGKSEAILALVGKNSRKIRAELFRSSDPSLALSSRLWPHARLRLVPRYKHLGGILHCSGSLVPELKTRCALAWQAFRKHRRLIFASPIVTHREKALLFQSLVLSSLLYGAGTWSAVDGSIADKLHSVVLAMARQMLRPTYNFEAACHLGAQKILAVARVPSARVLLHTERLRHLAVVIRIAPREFWAVLHHGSTWCRLAAESITWLCETLAKAGKAQPQLHKWANVLEAILQAPNIWKRWVRVAQQTALLGELWEAEVQHYHGLLYRSFLTLGASTNEVIDDDPTSPEVCAVCQQRFPDLRSWSHHAFKRHGRVKESRLVAQGTQCSVCLRHFATTFHLSNHLDHSKGCLAALVQHGHFVDTAPGRGSREFKDGKDTQLPAVSASGPLRQWSSVGYEPEQERAASGVIDGLTEIFGQPCDYAAIHEVLAAFRRVFLGFCLQKITPPCHSPRMASTC